MENEIKKAYEENDYNKVYELYVALYEKTKSIEVLYNKCYFACFILCDHYEEVLKELEILSKHKFSKEKKKYLALMFGRTHYILNDYIKANVYLTECVDYDFSLEEKGYIMELLANTNQFIFDKSQKEEYGHDAIKYYKMAMSIDDSNMINCLKGIVDVSYNIGNYDDAYDALIELMKLGVKDDTLYYYLAHIKMHKSEYKDALYYLELCKQYDEEKELESNIAACHYHLGDKQKGFEILKGIIKKNYDYDYLYQLLFFYYDSKMYKEMSEDELFDKILSESNDFKAEYANILVTAIDYEVALKGFSYVKELFISDPKSFYYLYSCASKAFNKQNEEITNVLKMVSECEDEEVKVILNYTLFLLYRSINNKEKTLEYLEKTPKDYDYYSHLSYNSPLIFSDEKKFKTFITNSPIAKTQHFRFASSVYGYKYLKCKKAKQEFKKIALNPKNLCAKSLLSRYFEFEGKNDLALLNIENAYKENVIEKDMDRIITDCNCYVSFYALYLLKGLFSKDKEKQYKLSKEVILHEIKRFKLCQHQNITYLYSYFALKEEKGFDCKYALLLLNAVEGENELDLDLYYNKYMIYEKLNVTELYEEYKNKFEKTKKYAPTKIVEYYEKNKGEDVIIPILNNN